jgi:hypothetical protein
LTAVLPVPPPAVLPCQGEEQERLEMIAAIADVCDDDIDAFVTELEDLGLV